MCDVYVYNLQNTRQYALANVRKVRDTYVHLHVKEDLTCDVITVRTIKE